MILFWKRQSLIGIGRHNWFRIAIDHDSYINCSKVIDDFTEEDIVDQIFHDIRRIQGELTETTKQEVIKVVESAKTIDKRTRAIIIASLKGK